MQQDEASLIVLRDLPLIWQAGLFLLAALGLGLWVTGRMVARGVCIITGLALGGVGGVFLWEHTSQVGPMLAWIIGGALGGFVLAWMFFRLWVGITCGALLALSGPAVFLIATGHSIPISPHTDTARFLQLAASDEAEAPNRPAVGFYQKKQEEINAWWAQLDAQTRRLALLVGGIGCLAGLTIGLVGPYSTAAFVSALVGACAAILSVLLLLDIYAPQAAQWATSSSAGTLMLLCLITLVGVLIQWMISRRQGEPS